MLLNLEGEIVLVLIRRYVFSYATSCPWVRAWHILDSRRHNVAPNTATHHRSDLGIPLNILALDRIQVVFGVGLDFDGDSRCHPWLSEVVLVKSVVEVWTVEKLLNFTIKQVLLLVQN